MMKQQLPPHITNIQMLKLLDGVFQGKQDMPKERTHRNIILNIKALKNTTLYIQKVIVKQKQPSFLLRPNY